MTLAEYLRKQRITAGELARQAGLSRQLVHAYLAGTAWPGFANVLRIRDATGGKVTANDFVRQHEQREAVER
jgi:DNA-binding phage protein